MAEENTQSQTTVLLAQREQADQRFLRAILEKLGGCRVIEARTAADVIHRQAQSPDLMLIDFHVEGNFIKAVELIRRMPQLNHVGIAIVTGDRRPMERCLNKGLNGYICKPFTPATFLAKVWRILDAAPPPPGDGAGRGGNLLNSHKTKSTAAILVRQYIVTIPVGIMLQ